MRKFLEAVAANEDDFSFENYGYGSTPSSVLRSVYTSGRSDFAMLYDVDQTAVGDMVASVELFNKVNGTDYDGLILDTETVAFYPEQIKNVDNREPTGDPTSDFLSVTTHGQTAMCSPMLWTETLPTCARPSPARAVRLSGLNTKAAAASADAATAFCAGFSTR